MKKKKNSIISRVLLELHPEKFIDLRSIYCLFQDLDDDNKLRFLTMLTEEKYPLGEFDPIDVLCIWMCICDDRDKDELREKLASKIARLVVSNSLDNLEKFDAERQMCLFFLITMKKKISPDLSEALDVVVDRYIHFRAQKLREMEITSFNREKERLLEKAAYYANLFTFPFLDYYPADNCDPELEIWSEDETAASDRIVNRILKFMEAFSKDDPIYFYFCESIFTIIMPRIPVDQMPHAMWLYWNVSKENALKRVRGKSYVYRLYGDSCKTLGRAAADGLVKGYGENKAFFTLGEACIVIKHATSRNEALRTLVNKGRIDFGESASLFKFSHFNDSEVESFLSKFVQVEK